MEKILIIGGTGSWGQELTRQILEKGSAKEIRIYSRGEHKQVEMARKFNDKRLNFIIGDIRDKKRLKYSAQNVDHIFHLAALKHVPVCEHSPEETVKTNIIGTINAVEVAAETKAKTFVLVSTDKAVDPINVYGVSKSLAEKIVVNANLNYQGIKFVCIRGGNVIGTNGSVVPLFKNQILRANEITITDKQMTRYFMRLQEAIGLIFKAVEDSMGGEIFVMKMPSVKITSLAALMIKELGNKSTKIKQIGIRPGEKIHEVLVSRYEAKRAFEQGNYYVILPNIDMHGLYKKYSKKSFLNTEYNSKKNRYLTQSELKSVLELDGWLDGKNLRLLEDYSKDELLEYFKRENWQQ
ncbi:MAG: polysaccharide biosynthesis protein [Bacteroidales bacterium]|nr:polysaccharide biosynthesis protein [Bacteroidales bacterium]